MGPCVDLLHLYDIRHLLTAQLPHPPGRLRAVLALWVEGPRLGGNGCQDTVTLARAPGLRGPRTPHPLRRRQRELRYDDADRHPGGPRSWGPGPELTEKKIAIAGQEVLGSGLHCPNAVTWAQAAVGCGQVLPGV